MSFYDLALGDENQVTRATLLLPVLGNPAFARYRDCWVEKSPGGPVIAVYTRQGGGKRECYCESRNATVVAEQHVPGNCCAACNEALAAHPLYLRDADDDFDSTYATFYFRVPADHQEILAPAAVDPVSMSERWQAAIDRISKGDLRPAEIALGDQLAATLGDPSPAAPRVMKL